ncbi:PEP-CTERM sorting domain-containing protein [Thalassotalea sp. PP2-459]|uniref:PEP-CTERM sorting domain-containing protein n=1 Tax=Thalassotalea sp. PP2-459 TaxID=1742724 RepID=UPI0011151AD7|nr:PEP-CTERM sorting domain-containing protein [Thalassotalea sp. PP2-459]
MIKLIKALSISAFLCTMSANATIIYSENNDGDLDAIGSTNVALVAGVNTITGSITQTPTGDTDRVKFTQLDGMTVDSIILSFSGIWDDANIGQSMSAALFNNVANLFDDNFNQINSGVDISASFFDSFGPETGPISQTTSGAIWDFQLSSGIVWPNQAWTLTINTSMDQTQPPVDIPEPSSIAVLLLALVGYRLTKRS